MLKKIVIYLLLCWIQSAAAKNLVQPRILEKDAVLDAEELKNIELFQKLSQSVVHISVASLSSDIFSMRVTEVPRGTGTGFIWDSSGHIVTNFHVIQGADVAKVRLSNNTLWDATLVGVAPERDLAILKIKVSHQELFPIPLGNSDIIKVGQKVYAIGNPFGLDQTLTTGIISAIGREINSAAGIPIKDVLQTDAAINPGNSGGPLLNSSGQLIGVNTAIYSPSGAYAGIGFAIPSTTVNWVVPELINYGKITRPTLGVVAAPEQINWQLGIEGALILQVEPGTPAAKNGLKETKRTANGQIILGDIITKIDQKNIRNRQDLQSILLSYKLGELIQLTLLRNNKSLTLKINLDTPEK